MARPTHRGRRVKPPTSAFGTLIAERLDSLRLSTQAFACRLGVSRTTVWRLLQGRTGFTNRVTLVDLCSALELKGEEREELVRAWARLGELAGGHDNVRLASATAATAADDRARMAPGDEPEQAKRKPPRPFVDTLKRYIQAANLSYSQLAKMVGVEPSTITRLVRGEVAMTHAVKQEAIAQALGLQQPDRRAFLELAMEAGLFAITATATASAGRFLAIERTVGKSLDEVEREVSELRWRRNQGEAGVAYERLRQLYTYLFDSRQHPSSVLKSPELARVKLLVGFEYYEAQAMTLGWFDRVPSLISTLDQMQQDVILYFPPTQFASQYGHLLNLRAPLHHQRSEPRSLEAACHKSIEESSWALEYVIPHIHEPTLHVELLRNRAHTYLLSRDVRNWRADLEAADRIASGIRGDAGNQFQALVTYSWGEGYKHLASWATLPERERARYHREALDCLQSADTVFERYHAWHGYGLLATIAQAQCLVWTDPDEALRRGDRLRATAMGVYPSLTAKVERMMEAADRQRRQWSHR